MSAEDNEDTALQHSTLIIPPRDIHGKPQISREEYSNTLLNIRRREPLREACVDINLTLPKSATLERLRNALVSYWYPNTSVLPQSDTPPPDAPPLDINDLSSLLIPEPDTGPNESEEALVVEFGVQGAAAEEVLGYDEGEELEEVEFRLGDGPMNNDDSDDEEETTEQGHYSRSGPRPSETHEDYRTRIRLEETLMAEQSRRAGGIKTQKAMVKAWKEFCVHASEQGQIKDDIIDEHHILLYIRFCSERPKRDRRGNDIPGTFIGASHIKKLYFGALRIRKEQEAKDPSLRTTRPVTSVHVWDALKGRMNNALQHARNGLVPEEDAPDIVANTFLAAITDEQIEKVGQGFLKHRELRSVINGHLCWTAQHASGNRGDDFRALQLAELQPYTFLHPDQQTGIFSILGCQGEEKAGASRGLRTKVNPVYSVFIAHVDPTRCPLGAFAFYLHFIHDYVDITKALNIDWSVNKSWRQIRVLHGKKSLSTPYHEQSLYNIYVKAFAEANFISRLKAHLPRHVLGYFQERMGVDASITSRMGWVRGETYYDTYAPALPKEAILGAHGYKVHELYDPVWRHVHVPEQFLHLVCPMAEFNHHAVVGRENLSGAANHWSMIMQLRPYLFQCGAAIYQKCPDSALFRLPAFANADVRNWMKSEFPSALSIAKASAGSPIDMARIQNNIIRTAMENMRAIMQEMTIEIQELRQEYRRGQAVLARRTEILTPPHGFSTQLHAERFKVSLQAPLEPLKLATPSLLSTSTDLHPTTPTQLTVRLQPQALEADHPDSPIDSDNTGVYQITNDSGDTSLRAFANASPKTRTIRRQKSQVDLILPPAAAFSSDNQPVFWPPVLGQKSVRWTDVYPLIKQPQMLWDCWRPSKTLDKYSLRDQWTCWSSGEAVFNAEGAQTGVKPPLRDVEGHFTSKNKRVIGWRSGISGSDRKAWERFREIPEYIDSEAKSHDVSPLVVLDELEGLMNTKYKGLSALSAHVKTLREEKALAEASVSGLTDDIPSSEDREGESTPAQPPLNTMNPKRRKKAVDARRPKKLKSVSHL